MEKPQPAEVFPLSEYLREELEAREWSRADLGRKVAMSAERIDEILTEDDSALLMHEAEQLGRAFDLNPELLLRLQLLYRRGKAADPVAVKPQ